MLEVGRWSGRRWLEGTLLRCGLVVVWSDAIDHSLDLLAEVRVIGVQNIGQLPHSVHYQQRLLLQAVDAVWNLHVDLVVIQLPKIVKHEQVRLLELRIQQKPQASVAVIIIERKWNPVQLRSIQAVLQQFLKSWKE